MQNGEAVIDDSNYEDVLKEELCKIKPCPEKGDRIKQLKDFIKRHMMALRADEANSFITVEMSAFDINRDDKTILKAFFKAEQKLMSKNKVSGDLKIHPKYKGMYTITCSKNDESVTVTPHTDKIAAMVMDNQSTVTYKDQIYVYLDGYYQVVTEIIEQDVVRILSEICKGANSNKVIQYKNSAMEYIRSWNIYTEYPFNTEKNMLNVKNGIVVIDPENYEIKIIEPEPKKYLFNYIIPTNYNADAPTEQVYNELLRYVDNPDSIIQPIAQALLQQLGYGPYKLFYVWQGGRDKGKTTASELIEAVIGSQNKSDIGLNELSVSNSKYNMSTLEGKIINMHDDMSYFKMDDAGVIKKLVGGFSHDIEKKNIQRYQANLTASHLFITNSTPSFDRRIRNDEAFWDKVIFTEFKNHFNKDYTYKKRMFTDENRSGFLNLIINMMLEAIVSNSIPITGDANLAREQWMKAGNPLYMFLLDNMTEGGETSILKDELVCLLQKWGEDAKKDQRIIPKNADDLVDHVKVCGGSIDLKKTFGGVERHSYTIPWTWNVNSKYRNMVTMTDRVQAKIHA